MEFTTSITLSSYALKSLWKSLKDSFNDDIGYCYYRYSLFGADRSKNNPDILLFHRKYGLYIIGCKDSTKEQILEDDEWMYSPISEVEDQLYSVLGKFRSEGALRDGKDDRVQGLPLIALPFMKRDEWREIDPNESKWDENLLFSEDLKSDSFKQKLYELSPQMTVGALTDLEWDLATGIIQGSPILKQCQRKKPKNQESKASILRKVEQQLYNLDLEQHKVGIQIPEGPQRIRGLAGSGKTVVMAYKAAWMHLQFPEWNIVYTFNTKSLYGIVIDYINRFYEHWAQCSPNWGKINVLHGWGGKDLEGLYSTICKKVNKSPLSYSQAQNLFGEKGLLGKSCNKLMEEIELPEYYDAILIDEGQDFDYGFYNFCFNLLKAPKRLIWAYDEVQSLDNLTIPTTLEIFGVDQDGNPKVSLEGTYGDGEIEKDMILYHCYRNPRPVLVTAHAFGMGLLRKSGIVQFIFNPGGWEDIGYEILESKISNGSFIPGTQLSIKRPKSNSPNIIEDLVGTNNLIECKAFTTLGEEVSWVAEGIKSIIEDDELRPEEILVICLDYKNSDAYYSYLYTILSRQGIKLMQANADQFRILDHVTFSDVFRAKGNEASVVWVIGFDITYGSIGQMVQARNKAFTAITRSKGWCYITGVGDKAKRLFDEIENIMANLEKISFKVPKPEDIQRNLDSLEYEKRRNSIKKVKEYVKKIESLLSKDDLKYLPPELRAKVNPIIDKNE